MKKINIVLDKLLAEKGMTRYELAKITGIQYQNLDHYYKNKIIRYDSTLLLKICIALECEPGDIIKIIEE